MTLSLRKSLNERVEVREVTYQCGGKCPYQTGRKADLWLHVSESHGWRRRGRAGMPGAGEEERTATATMAAAVDTPQDRTLTTRSSGGGGGRKRGRQGPDDPGERPERVPKARRSWQRPPDPALARRGKTIQGPNATPPTHRPPPGRVEGPRRSPRLEARNGHQSRPEPDPPPSQTRGG